MCKVFSLITTYEPDLDNLRTLVDNLRKQTSIVLIVNNSLYDIPEIISCLEHVYVINFGENLGIAKAQSLGMAWAFEHGAEFVLQMDQDSTPHNDMVQQLVRCYHDMLEINIYPGLIGAQDYDRYTGMINKARLRKGKLISNDYFNVDSTLSSGSLIPRQAWEKVGGMRDDLFIDAVDHEYCWRLRFNGFAVIRNKKALLGHRLGDGKFKILGLISVGMPSPFRHYYATRNIFLLIKEKHVPLSWKFLSLIKLSGKLMLYPIFMPQGKKRFYFFIKGILDGVLGRSGIMK